MEGEPPKAETPTRKRRPFQFRLRTLMLVTTAIAVVCWNVNLARGNWVTFYNLTMLDFFVLLILARTTVWFSRKGPGEYTTFF